MYKQEFKLIFNYAKDKTDDIEILFSGGNSFNVRVNQQEIEGFSHSDSVGIGVRVLKDGKQGYSYSEKLDDIALKNMVDEAVENAEASEDEEEVEMANYGDVENKPDVYSENLEKVSVEDKVQFAKDMENYALKADNRVMNVPNALMGSVKSYMKIANSKGLEKEDVQNQAFCFVTALVAEDKDKRMAMDFQIGRDFSKFDAKKLGETAVQRATDLLGGKDVKSGQYAVVFNNEMMCNLLTTFSGVFSAKAVQEGHSLLKGKLNKTIANEKVNIIDDGLYPGGFSTSAFDSEGFPSQKTLLVKNGVLNTFFHNTITAKKDGVQSTGNAARGIKSSLSVAPTNFYLEPGSIKEDELLGKYKEVIKIVSLQGLHSGANPVSGDFSLPAEGFLYENGKLKTSLKQFTVSGNFLQMLSDIEDIADNFRFNTSSVGSASVLVKRLAISG
ncbi:MAG: TldD/PmbA family protein [Candidatus Cloacimonadota bacterium]|nr:TldD/PmbA family protein [Candidatus Cloacimonadota bacterium]